MKNKVKLYNVFFPIWMLMLVPTMWLIALPANYIWDTIVLIIAMYIVRVKEKNETYKAAIIRVWLFGFLADLIGATIITIPQFLNLEIEAIEKMNWNPYENILSVVIILTGALISALMIYLLNKRFSFSRTKLDSQSKKRLAKILAIATLPYFFFVPTKYLYSTSNIDTIHIEEQSNLIDINDSYSIVKNAVKNTSQEFLDSYNKYIEYEKYSTLVVINVTDTEGTVGTQKNMFNIWAKEIDVKLQEYYRGKSLIINFYDVYNGHLAYTNNIQN